MAVRPVHRRRRPVRRRRRHSPGFWHGFRHATHTDHLRVRVGGAAGRAMIRRINRNRTRRGKAPIPQRGGDWYTLPHQVRRVAGRPIVRPARPTTAPRLPRTGGAGRTTTAAGSRVAGTSRRAPMQTKAQAKAAGMPPVFAGPGVTTTTGKAANRHVPFGSISVTSSGINGPGNTGAGPGIGVPPPGTPAGPGAPHSAVASPARPATPQNTTPTPTGGVMTQPTTAGVGGIEQLSETPETDAEYVAALRGLSEDVRGWGDRIEEIQASLLEHVGMDQAALGAYSAMAEHAQGMADAVQQAVIDFLNTYQGVIETAQSGVKIPGGEGRFFTGDVA